MFKLESYITPLLLSYVDKYIKNLKPEDSQFSLWGGDAVFSNLDLRLDVLEQELQLPFTFINGHIHELRIHIPWTKLGSEPVIITINTIECILKLCTDKDASDADSAKKSACNRNTRKQDVTEAPPGYVQSLINRVISNICIICNNLILKYVEDDIVLSLNIKSVELFNANEKWDKAFVDTNIADTVSRKVIYMQDLTVCLDKRDASGKIETYQDPLLYRCSSTWRMYSVYNSPHSKYPALTRIHMYCENLDFSLTDQQLPMFLRLLYLCIALHNKSNLTSQESTNTNKEHSDVKTRTSDEELGNSDIKSHDESWGSWAWSYIPDVSPIWTYPGSEEEQEKESNMLKSKKIFQFGIYIGKSSCILKHTVFPQDSSYCGSSKCTFSPLMIVNMYGCSMELTLKGKDFVNVQSGICGVIVTGLESCVCGYQDFSNNNDLKNIFLKSGVPPGSGHAYSFLSSSLFDPLAPENCNQERKYCFNSAEHISTFTEEAMVQRFPAFAFDYLYELEVPEEWMDRISSITSSFLEGSNWHETSMYRLVFGPLCLDITSSLIHRLRKLMISAQDYDYPYYAQSRKASIHSVDINEEMIEDMEEFVPIRQYHMTFFKPVFRLSVADHSLHIASKIDPKKGKKRHIKSKYIKAPKAFENFFCFEIYADCLDLHSSSPLYPNKLVKIMETIAHPSQFLICNCYNSHSMKIFGLEITLHKENSNAFSDSSIIQQTCLAFFMKSLILSENWGSAKGLTLKESSFECSSLHFRLSEINFLAIIAIYQSWTAKYFNANGLENLKIALDETKNGSPMMCAEISDISFLYLLSEDVTSCKFSISKVCLKFLSDDRSSVLYNAPEPTNRTYTGIISETSEFTDCIDDNSKYPFLRLLLQVPKNESNEDPVLLVVRVSGSTACVEPALFAWMSSALFPHIDLDKSNLELSSSSSGDIEDASTCSSVTQEASASHSLSKSHSSVIVNMKRRSLHETFENFLLQYSQVLTYLIIEVEIGSLCGIMPQSNWSMNHQDGVPILKSWQEAELNNNLNGACVLCLPSISMRNNSSVSDFLQNLDVAQVCLPYKMLHHEKKSQDFFPWTLQINSSSIYTVEANPDSRYRYLLLPTTVSATIALSTKGNQNQLALCIHMDSKCVNLNLFAFQANLFVNCFNTISVSANFAKRVNSWISYFHLKLPDLPEYERATSEAYALDEYIDVKKGYDIASQCKKTSHSETKSIETEDKKISQRLTLWTQLTLSKLCLILNGKLPGSTNHENFKVQFDAEEIVSSLDIQEVYTKVKTKLSSLNINCFTKKTPDCNWEPGPFEGRVLFCNNMMSNNVKPKTLGQHSHAKPDNQPFLVATYTQALHSNVKEKLYFNAKQKTKIPVEDLKYISEIDLKVKSFGVILWMSVFDTLNQLFYPFLKTSVLTYNYENTISESSSLMGIGFCTQNLPLFYIETNAIQIYFPDNNVLTNKTSENLACNENNADVLLLQLDSVTLTSQVENPLPRIVLDSDIYTSALNSKTIGVPGAAVEDRQYQLDVYGFTLGTVYGSNILHPNDLKRDFIPHYPLTMGENPALEWNIGVIPENRNYTNDSVMITSILSPFNVRVAVAPAIVCANPSKEYESQKIIVSGISSEVSITNKVYLYLSIHQMCVVHTLLKNNLNFFFETFLSGQFIQNSNVNSQFLQEQTCSFFPSYGLSSDTSSNVQVHPDGSGNCKYNFVPFELLVTAENISIMLFYHDIVSRSPKKDETYTLQSIETFPVQKLSNIPLKTACGHESKQSNPIDSAFELNCIRNIPVVTQNTSPLIKLHPFLCLSIVQPHSYVLCHPSSQKFESSCFDLLLDGSSIDYTIEKPHESCTPITEDFTLHYLETKSGELSEKTGIPPAFFTVTCTDIFSDPANIKISLERPVKLNFRNEMLDSALAFLQCFKNEFAMFTMPSNSELASDSNDLPVKMKILTYFKSVVLLTTQIVIEISPALNLSSEKLILSTSNVTLEADIEGSKETVKCLNLNLDISSFVVQTSECDQVWNFVQPLSFSAALKCHLKPCLQAELNLVGESLLVNLSLYHVLKLKRLIEDLMKLIDANLSSLRSIVNSKEVENTNSYTKHYESQKRTQWNDDLRKGAFQFVQISESSDCQPKTNEIVFCRASANQPAYMSWCYPEPRALTKIEVSPVPFQCGEESDKKVLTCYLQYWSSALQEYMNFFDFVLSETEHFSLNLPDLNSDSLAVSDKWRVLLDCGSYIDDDGISEKENPYLSPLALAACMSIDSCFDPSLVPALQVRTSFELVKIISYCSFKKTGCSPKLFPFEYDDESPLVQEFSILSFINPSCSYIKKTSKIKGELSSGLKCEILEYRNLTMLPVLSPVDIHTNVTLNFDKNIPVFDMELVLHPCFVRLSQSVIHTLTYTVHSVSQEIEEAPSSCIEYVLPNHYIICNNLEVRIRFGQAGTEENIILSPLKMHAYSWWCHKNKQLLWLSVGSLRWKWSKEFSIDKEGITIVPFDKNIAVIIKIKQLTNLQKQVIIDGQFVVHSQLSFPIQMRCEFPICTPAKAQTSSPLFIKSLLPEHSSPSFLLCDEQCKNMRLSVTGILDSQFWSENISLGDNKVLQIPWETNNLYQSVWCQVLQQKISDSAYSIAVFLSPLFILRNNLPVSLKVDIVQQDQNKTDSFELLGKGHEIKLLKPCNSDLNLNFHSTSDLNISIPLLSVSISDMNELQSKEFENNEQLWEKYLKMQSLQQNLWPYSFLERSPTLSTIDSLYPCAESNKTILPAVPSSKVVINVKIERSLRWGGLKTILYDIKPRVILVNRLRRDLFLFVENDMEWTLPPNSVAIPSKPDENFRLSIFEDGKYFFSSLLSVENKLVKKKTSEKDDPEAAHFSLKTSQNIPKNGSINIIIKVQLGVFKVFLFKLKSEMHEDIIVITAFPLIILSNDVNHELQFSLFCLPSSCENMVSPLENASLILNTSEDCHPLLFWDANCSQFSTDYINLSFYVLISVPSCQTWSYPVYLDPKQCDSVRHAISVPIDLSVKSTTTLPLVMTSHWSNGLLFLVLNTDPCPLLLLHNRTSMNIFYGQSSSGTEGKYVFEELLKHAVIPLLIPESSAHYSFPSLQKLFPRLPEKPPMLCLGLKEDTTFVWSIPFKVNVDKQFVHILGVCDFMVHSERIGHTIKLYIDPVNRIEVTANEVRSRIALATDINLHTDKTEVTKPKASYGRKNTVVKIRRKSHNKTMKNTKKDTQFSTNFLNVYFINFRIIHMSVIICDELKSENAIMEVLRLNISNAIFSSRPQKESSISRLQDISLCFEHIQLDNQIDEEDNVVYDFPVVFHRYVTSKTNQSKDDCDTFLPNKIRENSMFILNAIVELPSDECNAIVIQSLNVDLLPVSLQLEDTFYYKVVSLVKTYFPISFHQHESPWSDIYLPKDIKYTSLVFMHPLHFQNFIFNIQEISLSLHASLKLYLSLEHSLLRFQPFAKEELFASPYEVGRMLVLHYLTGALFRAGWVVGSLDLLGNPAGFARAVGAGMSDFVYLPYQGLLHGPRAFISGLTCGAVSLFTQVSSGAISCMASLASSISKNMDFLCLDDEHLARQELMRRHLPQDVSAGLVQGLSVFGLSVLGAVAGIVDHPLQVLMSPSTPMKTASGVVGGFGKGIVGVFTKPIGGAAELLSQAGYGFLHGAGWLNLPKRQYQPITMSLEMGSSSIIKYLCKVALCQSLGDVLLSVEATYVNENGEYEKNILLLTSEALCILTEDEVTLHRTFALTEIRCKKAESDKSTLIIIPSRALRKQVFLESDDVLDRVTDYLKKNRADVTNTVESTSFHTDIVPESLIKSSSYCHVFFLYPKDRNLFLTLFNYAKSKALRKGF